MAALLLIAGGAWLALALQSRVDGSHAGDQGGRNAFLRGHVDVDGRCHDGAVHNTVGVSSSVDSIVSEVTLEDIPRVTRAMLGGHTRGRILVRPSEQ